MAMSIDKYIALLLLILCFGSLGKAQDKALNIQPVYQQQKEWCWIATGQMILNYFHEPAVNPIDYQCGIVGLYFGPHTSWFYNCNTCNVPAHSTAALRWMLSRYPVAAAAYLHRPPASPISTQESAALGFASLMKEIDHRRPVLAGINPSGQPHFPLQAQHAVLIIGYDKATRSIIVNDPFPYNLFGAFPYQRLGGQKLQQGQYSIGYWAFKNRLGWSFSLYDIVDPN